VGVRGQQLCTGRDRGALTKSVQELEQGAAGAPPVAPDSVIAQRISLWLAPIAAAFFVAIFVTFPGFHPPMSPDLPADQVAAFFAEHTTAIRTSMIMFDVCGLLLLPFLMVIVVQMKRMATPSHAFAYAYLSAIATGATLFALPELLWLIAAFRPERDPDLILLLNDLAWIIFTAPVGMFVAANICLALAIYLDAQPTPVFPRWIGHFNIATAALVVPAAAAAVVHSGPFAWDGAVSFWLKLSTLATWLVVMFFAVRAAIDRQPAMERR
jgi:hypothetical protein